MSDMDISRYENTAPVWVGNWGKYNEGELVGDWITLPVSNEELGKFLKEKVLIGTPDAFGVPYEEFGIFDTDEYDNTLIRKLGLDVGEHTGLRGLNDLAKICSTLSDQQLEALGGYLEIDSTRNIYEVANYALQVDKLPYNQFDGDLPEHWPDDEKLGYTFAANSEMYSFLDEHGIVNYFDFAAYGRDIAQDATFTANGWIWDSGANLDSDFYNLGELSDIADQRFEDSGFEVLKTIKQSSTQTKTENAIPNRVIERLENNAKLEADTQTSQKTPSVKRKPRDFER
jgi:antirestriction protein